MTDTRTTEKKQASKVSDAKLSKHHQKQQDISVKLNRLRSQKAVLEHRLKKSAQTERRARTRTLIQMGALLNLTDFPILCGIEEGDDLQLDLTNMDKAATLLGILITLQDQLYPHLSPDALEAFKKIGIRKMKGQQKREA